MFCFLVFSVVGVLHKEVSGFWNRYFRSQMGSSETKSGSQTLDRHDPLPYTTGLIFIRFKTYTNEVSSKLGQMQQIKEADSWPFPLWK